jgi:putative ABC transport system ATP-binding protein
MTPVAPPARDEPPAAVILDGVSKRYGPPTNAVVAVNEVSLRIASGEFVSIMGPSGCGKSTLLHLMAGIDTPSAGHVVIAGEDLAQMSDNERSDIRLERISIVFQAFHLFPRFTVEENVSWPLEYRRVGYRQAKEQAHAVLEQVGISAAAFRRRPTELSGGEQQRVAIARALVTQPLLLLADEPTGNLDSRTGETILDLLRTLNVAQQLTVVMVTHNLFAATYGRRTVELRDGAVVRDDSPPSEPHLRVVRGEHTAVSDT